MNRNKIKHITSLFIFGIFLLLAFGSSDTKNTREKDASSTNEESQNDDNTSNEETRSSSTQETNESSQSQNANESREDNSSYSSEPKEESQNTSPSQLKAEFLGTYHGIQPSYYMRNKFGDEIIVRGNKVSVPSYEMKFILKENNFVSLQQTVFEDNSRYYYDGTIKVLEDASDIIKLECSLNDRSSSSTPKYTLIINKSDKSTTCVGTNEPECKLEKSK